MLGSEVDRIEKGLKVSSAGVRVRSLRTRTCDVCIKYIK